MTTLVQRDRGKLFRGRIGQPGDYVTRGHPPVPLPRFLDVYAGAGSFLGPWFGEGFDELWLF